VECGIKASHTNNFGQEVRYPHVYSTNSSPITPEDVLQTSRWCMEFISSLNIEKKGFG
jgi:hypothetical protein